MTQPRSDEFILPPECPVFEPSWEEFADPFAFINKIRPIAEKTGICKVRPPPGWQPPFACDVERLHFTPRIQRLNELEAQTRVKLNFLDKIAKFWELQGCALRIPHVERKILDLFQLNKLVESEGGFDTVCRERHWTKIALKMGFAPGKAVGSHLRGHYERILYPFSLFQAGASLLAPELASKLVHLMGGPDPNADTDKCIQNAILTSDIKDEEYKPHELAQRQSVHPAETCPPARRAKRMRSDVDHVKTDPEQSNPNRPNLRRRTGSSVPKPELGVTQPALHPGSHQTNLIQNVLGQRSAALFSTATGKEVPIQVKQESIETELLSQAVKDVPQEQGSNTMVDQYVCLVCSSGSEEERLLLCDGCDDSYHTFCLVPPLHDVPKGDWRCPKCVAKECSKPQEAFGFQQAHRDYTLCAFGEMADAFKSDYFNMPVHMVPTELVEKEFWRLVGAVEEDVTVEYGADIASKEFGSGFPVRNGKFKVTPQDETYLDCGWNLNNMALMDPSVLTHITSDICGMTLPWLYVGMCFSCFCWHIEDHWSYSINYLHWGEPKTWYGAPGFAAEQLEDVMKKLAPELFVSQPDLLHQLVTIMNPNTLMAYGVPIYHTNQCAGEFVITFPRAYHSGFNQGFNFAEAVNFCTVDWMPLGRQCVDHYRLLHRYCVFSHDEMVCKMASKIESLDVVLASAVQKDLAIMIEEEQRLRDKVQKMGVERCESAQYDHLQDDERQCTRCRTTCFLSAITCPCSPGVLACLHHAQDLCYCPPSSYTLNYRFTVDDLYPMLRAVRQRAKPYDDWASRVNGLLENKSDQKKSVVAFLSLIKESEAKAFPDNDLLRHLRLVTQEAQRCQALAQQLLRAKRHTRYRPGGGKCWNKLTVEELKQFVRQLYSLPCSISQAPLLKELLDGAENLQQQCEELLAEEAPCVGRIQALLDACAELGVAVPGLSALQGQLERVHWLEAVRTATSRPACLSLDSVRQLIDRGVGLTAHPTVERALARLQGLLSVSEHWEDKACALITAKPYRCLETLAAAVREVERIPAYLPNCLLLQDAVSRAKQWVQEAESIKLRNQMPQLGSLSALVSKGKSIPVHLEALTQLESLLSEGEAWKESAGEVFLLPNSPFSLLEVLCPRCEAPKKKPKKALEGSQHSMKETAAHDPVNDVERALSECREFASSMAILEKVRLKEMEAHSAFRLSNDSKLHSKTDADSQVCVCHSAPTGGMLQCRLCRDIYHSSCMEQLAAKASSSPWLCLLCCRSQRPPLAKVFPLLASLHRLRVRLPEGDALRFLVRRAMSWQSKAKRVLVPSESREIPASYSTDADEEVPSCPESASCPLQEQQHDLSQGVFQLEQQCLSNHDVSPDLEEIITEGLLLQVSLPELQQLHCIMGDGLAAQQAGTVMSDTVPRVLHSSDSQGVCPSEVEESVCGPVEENLREVGRITKRHIEPHSSQAECWDKPKKAKWSREEEDPEGEARPAFDTEEDISLCPAEKCLQPEGDEVDWIQCDGSCSQWFHQMCVGVSSQLTGEDFVCVSCDVREKPVAE
ncbi:lysine-specific demethylase 5B-B-like isoform X2 [Brienomyrus brachyistius]|uniref:lysine-specific demethylase 5B-B-like isoform X2 n=1 Tax=Brienomyrus brachyistius TaxID=42636 RepID=UPI0020B38691|nr:lysine-specific demethylase 5B-B-like isoform X2 [Brienomyrus brachyistius]